jgi:hypothetical protein
MGVSGVTGIGHIVKRGHARGGFIYKLVFIPNNPPRSLHALTGLVSVEIKGVVGKGIRKVKLVDIENAQLIEPFSIQFIARARLTRGRWGDELIISLPMKLNNIWEKHHRDLVIVTVRSIVS